MWKQSDHSTVENPDNYLAAIERAKEGLNKINSDIKTLTEQRAILTEGNNLLLKEKLEELDNKREQLEALLIEHRENKAKNLEESKLLEDGNKKLSNDIEYFRLQKESYFQSVQNKEKDIQAREQYVNDTLVTLDNIKIEIDARENEIQENLNKILNEKKNIQNALDETLNTNKQSQEYLIDVSAKLENVKRLKKDIDMANLEAKDSLVKSQSALEESIHNKAISEENLTSTLKERDSIKDLIIENKKSKLEAINVLEIAQKNIVDANQKIAELKELKEAMAQREK